VENIDEASKAAASSGKTELKLTQVAYASFEETMRNYEDYLSHSKLPGQARHYPLKQALHSLFVDPAIPD